jgi:hypothetical protein
MLLAKVTKQLSLLLQLAQQKVFRWESRPDLNP